MPTTDRYSQWCSQHRKTPARRRGARFHAGQQVMVHGETGTVIVPVVPDLPYRMTRVQLRSVPGVNGRIAERFVSIAESSPAIRPLMKREAVDGLVAGDDGWGGDEPYGV
jgi:hypothetical protein